MERRNRKGERKTKGIWERFRKGEEKIKEKKRDRGIEKSERRRMRKEFKGKAKR